MNRCERSRFVALLEWLLSLYVRIRFDHYIADIVYISNRCQCGHVKPCPHAEEVKW